MRAVRRLLRDLGAAILKPLPLTDEQVELLIREASEDDIYVAMVSSAHTAAQGLRLTMRAQELRAAKHRQAAA